VAIERCLSNLSLQNWDNKKGGKMGRGRGRERKNSEEEERKREKEERTEHMI
jgi:hypothetical protein